MRSDTRLLLSICVFLKICCVDGSGAVFVDFSGGNGTALTMTIPNDITFSGLSLNLANVVVVVVDANPGNITSSNSNGHSGTSSLAGVNDEDGGFMGYTIGGDLTAEDVYVGWFGSAISDTGGNVVLSAGNRISDEVLLGSTPSNGSFTIRLADNSGNFIGNEGIQAVPEPHYTLFASVFLLFFSLSRLRRRTPNSS